MCDLRFLGIRAASGERYQVAIGATNFDGPGFEEVYRCHGKNSLEGCVKWEDAMGVYISRGRTCYPGYRRFLAASAPERRLPEGPGVDRAGVPLQFPARERLPPPTRKTYESMMASARAVEANGPDRSPSDNVRGIKGVHVFAVLPYFSFTYMGFDLMHIIGNIVKMLLHLLRRHTATHPNRAVAASVLAFEHAQGRFLEETPNEGPSWAFTSREETLVDQRLRELRASDKSAAPRSIFRLLGMQNTHALMTFAFSYAHHCMSDLGSLPHTTAILNMFEILRLSASDSFDITEARMKDRMQKFVRAAVDLEGLFPCSEMTYAFSQFVFCLADIKVVGPPRTLWMYAFEAVHKELKSLVHNKVKYSSFCTRHDVILL